MENITEKRLWLFDSLSCFHAIPIADSPDYQVNPPDSLRFYIMNKYCNPVLTITSFILECRLHPYNIRYRYDLTPQTPAEHRRYLIR